VNKGPKISIITVCFNSAKTINDTIKSIKSQDYNNIEYIVIDGKSLDSTIKIIKSHNDFIDYFVSEKDNGIYDAMNKGIRAATGDIIGILNSDDFYQNNSVLSDVASAFQKNNRDCLYGDLVFVKANNKNKIVRYWKAGEFSIVKLKNGWTLPHPTFFVCKRIYDRFGLYNIDLKSASDYEMILRLLYKYNISVDYIPKVLVKMRTGGQSTASLLNRFKGNMEDTRAWKINRLKAPFLIRYKKPIIKIKQFFKKPGNE